MTPMKIKISDFNKLSLPSNSEIKIFKKVGATDTLLDIEDIQISSIFDGRTRKWSVNIQIVDKTNPKTNAQENTRTDV